MKSFWLVIGLAACAGGAEPTDETDGGIDPDVDCVEVVDGLSQTLTRAGEAAGAISLRSSCSQEVTITEVGLAALAPGFDLDFAGSAVLSPGAELPVALGFTATEPGSFSDTLVIDFEALDRIEVPVSIEVVGPELVAEVTPAMFVRTCPSSIALSLRNDAAEGEAEISGASALLDDVSLDWGLASPTWIAPGAASNADLDLTLSGSTATVTVQIEDALVGPKSWAFPLETDPTAERTRLIPKWEAGRPVDLLITVDRTFPGYDPAAAQEGVAQLFGRLADMDMDVRGVGLLRDTGCPLGTAVASSEALDRGVETLWAQLDLSFSRVGETGIEDRPFELVSVALDPSNTAEGGCNAWRRADAALLIVHVSGRDDASLTSVEDHLDAVRARLPAEDHLAVASMAPATPDGCWESGGATRLTEAAAKTDSPFIDLCESDVAGSMSRLAVVQGEENHVRLEEAPYLPSLEVLANGKAVDVTVDGLRLTLPRSVDRYRDDVEIRYVAASACPEG